MHDVLRLPYVQAIHKLTDQKIDLLLAALEAKSTVLAPVEIVSAAVPRDLSPKPWTAP